MVSVSRLICELLWYYKIYKNSVFPHVNVLLSFYIFFATLNYSFILAILIIIN